MTVKDPASKTGYARSEFGSPWSDSNGNGCREREDVLNRDLTAKKFDGCKVLSGLLRDPYTGESVTFRRGQQTSADVQIDHVVALPDAWRTGAQQWGHDKRVRFANDTMNLMAVGRASSTLKADGDTATWLPPEKSFRCEYVARQVTVKKEYGLWATTDEQKAMIAVLSGCANLKLVKRAAIPGHPAPKPEPKPQPPVTDAPDEDPPSDGGGSCAPGYSPCVPPYPPDVNCSDVDGPITVTGSDPHGLDRDHDGIACES